MIIVNQDKTAIINFDCISGITLSEDGLHIGVTDNWGLDTFVDIGTYKTEERAKEVLQEIIKKYSEYLELQGGPAILQGQSDVQPNIFILPKIYKMPEK